VSSFSATKLVAYCRICLSVAACAGGSTQTTPGVDGSSATSLGPSGGVSALFNGVPVELAATGSFPDAFAAYSTSQDRTSVHSSPRRDAGLPTQSIDLAVRGKSPGSYSCGDEPDGGLTIFMLAEVTGVMSGATYSTTNIASVTPCTIVIAQYPPVGGHMTGTFSGTLIATMRSGLSGNLPPQTLDVKAGVFDVIRLADIP
jgi:hypothetical protein